MNDISRRSFVCAIPLLAVASSTIARAQSVASPTRLFRNVRTVASGRVTAERYGYAAVADGVAEVHRLVRENLMRAPARSSSRSRAGVLQVDGRGNDQGEEASRSSN